MLNRLGKHVKNMYIQARIFISLNWELEFPVHIDAS
jgi:hypothetical protein